MDINISAIYNSKRIQAQHGIIGIDMVSWYHTFKSYTKSKRKTHISLYVSGGARNYATVLDLFIHSQAHCYHC